MKRLSTLLLPLLALFALSSAVAQELEMWTLALSPTFDDYINGVIAEFEAEHPGVTVNWVDLPDGGFPDKFFASVAAGQAPDVVNLNTSRMRLAVKEDALVNLSENATDEQLSIYFPSLLDSSSVNGSVYAFPWYQAPTILMYNKSIFEQAGLDPESPPATYEEAIAMAQTIREATFLEGIAPLPFPEDWLVQNGVDILSEDGLEPAFNTPEGVAALQIYVDAVQNRAVSQDAINFDYQKAIGDFAGGQDAMLVTGPQFLRTVESDGPEVYANLGLAPYPLTETGIIPNAIQNMVVPKASDNVDLAIELANFVTNDANQLAFAKLVSIFPSTTAAAGDEFFCSDQESLEGRARCIQAQSIDRSFDNQVRQDIKDEIRKAFGEAMIGQKTAEQALEDAATTVSVLAKE
ncbi:sugar ABC transporter substrate-binding protein [soil metagenome]